MKLKNKERLDKLLVERGLVETRAKAQALILAGQVFSNQQRLEKAGQLVAIEAPLSVKETMPFVSRGGLKLAAALDHFGVDATGKVCLDIGASTGGFTQVLLERGAAHVIALDVGHGQMDERVRADPRVTCIEGVNARDLAAPHLGGKSPDFVVSDMSFISLRLVLPEAHQHARTSLPDAAIAVVPHRDTILFAPQRDTEALEQYARELLARAPHPISARALPLL